MKPTCAFDPPMPKEFTLILSLRSAGHGTGSTGIRRFAFSKGTIFKASDMVIHLLSWGNELTLWVRRVEVHIRWYYFVLQCQNCFDNTGYARRAFRVPDIR